MNLLRSIAIGLVSALFMAVGFVTWRLDAASHLLDEQRQQIQTLKKALSDRSTQDGLALQEQCSRAASTFVFDKAGNKPGAVGLVYQNHFNSKLKRCFVLVSDYQPKMDFQSIDLYDAVENTHYAMFSGYRICDVRITRKPGKCDLNGGSIWVDGNDSKRGEVIGFQGSAYGPGVGDEHTQDTFRSRIQPFMTE
jgi:hypothetical protein